MLDNDDLHKLAVWLVNLSVVEAGGRTLPVNSAVDLPHHACRLTSGEVAHVTSASGFSYRLPVFIEGTTLSSNWVMSGHVSCLLHDAEYIAVAVPHDSFHMSCGTHNRAFRDLVMLAKLQGVIRGSYE